MSVNVFMNRQTAVILWFNFDDVLEVSGMYICTQ